MSVSRLLVIAGGLSAAAAFAACGRGSSGAERDAAAQQTALAAAPEITVYKSPT